MAPSEKKFALITGASSGATVLFSHIARVKQE